MEVICPTCSNQFSLDVYMLHLPSCYYTKCENLHLVPLCMCSHCKGTTVHPTYVASSDKRIACGTLATAETSPFNNLPSDLVSLILCAFQETPESYFVGMVCKQWNNLVKRDRKIKLNTVVQHYASNGNFSALKLLKQWTIKITYAIFDKTYQTLTDAAASCGRIDILQWAVDNGVTILKTACCEAALGGHLETLQWLKSLQYPWKETEAIAALAIKGGHLDIVKWLYKNECQFPEDCCDYAAMGGSLETLKWLREKGFGWSGEAITHAAGRGHLHILQWLLLEDRNENRIHFFLYSSAAVKGHFEILKWAKSHGIQDNCTSEDIALASVFSGNLEMLQWILQEFPSKSEKLMMYATTVEMLEWLKSAGYQAKNTAAWRGNIPALQWLIKNNAIRAIYACSEVAASGKLEALKLLRENDYPWFSSTIECASSGLHSDVAKWAIDNGCPINSRTCDTVASSGDLETLKYLLERGYTFSRDFDYEEIGKCKNLELFKLVMQQKPGHKWSQWIHENAPHYEILEWAYKQGCYLDDGTHMWRLKLILDK